MKKWKEILSDSSLYPDDFTVALKDGQTMTLADMRAYDRENEGALTARLSAREKEIEKREKTVNDASISLGSVVEKVAASSGLTVEELLQGKTPTKRVVAAATELDENDPLVGSVVKQLKTLQAKLDSVEAASNSLRKDALGPMLNTYLDDFYESRWEKLSPGIPEGAKVERQQAMEYAQKNGLKDAKGRLDLDKALRDLTYEDRVKADAKKMAADLRKKDDDARVLASVPKPGGNLGAKIRTDKSLTNEKGMTKNFDEMLAMAQEDTEMWRAIEGKSA